MRKIGKIFAIILIVLGSLLSLYIGIQSVDREGGPPGRPMLIAFFLACFGIMLFCMNDKEVDFGHALNIVAGFMGSFFSSIISLFIGLILGGIWSGYVGRLLIIGSGLLIALYFLFFGLKKLGSFVHNLLFKQKKEGKKC